MALIRDDVKRAARLARIAIEESEADQVLEQLTRIFGMIEQIQALDVSEVEPMSHAQDVVARLRDDVSADHIERERYQSLAPQIDAGLYLVPKVIE